MTAQLTTTEAAVLINRPAVTVRYWAKIGWIKAEKRGRDWMIDKESLLKCVASPRKAGRPKNG